MYSGLKYAATQFAVCTLVVFSPLSAQSLADQAAAVFAQNCYGCHSAAMQMSGLQLTSRESILKGGSRGPAIVPGDPKSSRIYQFISHAATPNMPPGKQLPPDTIAVIQKWIEAGAPWPAQVPAAAPAPQPTWWSFKPPVRPAVSDIRDPWIRTPLDAFVLAKLREQHLHPASDATRAELIRRAYFDLTGLPAAAGDVEAFVRDPAPDAYEKLIDKLLTSPRYGEKWGRQWLDLVRYSDTAGFELDAYNADAWRYRDWVINSFNEDKPYDRFIKEQIAGDELWPDDPVAKTGTGYFCVGPNMDLYADQQDINRVQTLTDYVDTTGAVFLGLTVGCARCHDHKFDPIPQRDYYRMQAIFEPAVKTEISLNKLSGLGYNVAQNVREVKLQEISDEISSVESGCRNKLKKEKALSTADKKDTRVSQDEVRACLSPGDAKRLHAIERELVSMVANYRPKPFACGVTEMSRSYPVSHIPARGGGFGAAVTPGYLSAIGGGDVPEPQEAAMTTGRRKAFAEWIASPQNPLTARVVVNRIWQGHFSRGIVATPSDFGRRGAKPSHPELLDWLSVEFVARGWSMKKLHRLIMTSSVYRQSTAAADDARERDPENIYLSHMNRRRLTAEEIRDSVLQGSGALNLKMFGRPVVPPLGEAELFGLTGKPDEKWIVTQDKNEANRRSIYLFARRTYRLPMLEVFDAPESVFTCPRRESSTTSTQSLTLLNSAFTLDKSEQFAAVLAKDHATDEALIRNAWRSILARDPALGEAAKAASFLAAQKKNLGTRQAAAAELVRSLFNLNEFLYVE